MRYTITTFSWYCDYYQETSKRLLLFIQISIKDKTNLKSVKKLTKINELKYVVTFKSHPCNR